MTSVAIMQPYFLPYAGYFRLMQSADIFVFYDCVQYTRRGYIHRNKVSDLNGNLNWLTLPILKQKREIKINQLKFQDNAQDKIQSQLRQSKLFSQLLLTAGLKHKLFDSSIPTLEYICNLLKHFCKLLNISTQFYYSSKFQISNEYRGQNRILEICKKVDADRYINSPNGKSLYEENTFAKKGIQLSFLPEYQGNYFSILEDYLLRSESSRQDLITSIKTQSI